MKGQVGLLSVEEMILLAISVHKRYGLEIIKVIKDVSGGERKISYGSMYPALYKLERKKMIKSSWSNDEKSIAARRKYYELTEKGRSVLWEAEDLRAMLLDHTDI